MNTLDEVKNLLTDNGYTYELHELLGYFKISIGNSCANLAINPDCSLSLFLYNRGDSVTDEDKKLTNKIISTLEALGYKNEGAGEENSDCYFKKLNVTDELTEKQLEQTLNIEGFDVIYIGLIGGGYISITGKDGKRNLNGKSNMDINLDGTLSFFSDSLDTAFDLNVISIIETLGYRNIGRGEDGATYFFLPPVKHN